MYIIAIILKSHLQVRVTTVSADLSQLPYALGPTSYAKGWLQSRRNGGDRNSLYLAVVFPELPTNHQPSLTQ